MRWLQVLIAAAMLLIAMGAPCLGTEPIEIPLQDIWANQIPGTKSISKFDLSRLPRQCGELSTGPLGGRKHTNESPAPPGFVVRGAGFEALVEAHRPLLPEQAPVDVFRAGEPLSIVFSSRTYIWYVHVIAVKQEGDAFVVEYRFVPHETRELTSHLALIPIGPLTPGEYTVEMKALPHEAAWTAAGFPPVSPQVARRVVCSSFRFRVVP
ncbi:MAG: hypothetical protein ACRCT8_11650 [Lacipirellulaceae bacterium]